MAASPAKSPRLPSPPPIAEDQLGPNSPLGQTFTDASGGSALKTLKYAASRRIRPGAKSEDMLEGPPVIDLQDIDSAFQLTEHLKAVYAAHVTPEGDPDTIRSVDKDTAVKLARPPAGTDREIWLYELCRFLTQKANALAIGLFGTDPPCSAQTCHEMRAGEWQYLCAAHDPPKSCCAIDYCCHTLDWAATQLTNSTLFPSRLALGTEGATSTQQLRKMTEIFRRVYRIFAHAWFQHHEVFWQIENKTGLYVLFKTVCDEYRLIPEDNYTIPPEAEGQADVGTAATDSVDREISRGRGMPVGNVMIAKGNTTKRHRGSRMEVANSVSTIIHEEGEDDPSKSVGAAETTNQNETEQRQVKINVSRTQQALPLRLKAQRNTGIDEENTDDESEDVLTAIDHSADVGADGAETRGSGSREQGIERPEVTEAARNHNLCTEGNTDTEASSTRPNDDVDDKK